MTFRVRKMDVNGDHQFGHSQHDFLADTPEAVALVIGTRLRLWVGDWYLDLREGTPYLESILGKSTQNARDAAIRFRIAETPFVLALNNYFSHLLSPGPRDLTVQVNIITSFGTIQLMVPLAPASAPFILDETPLDGQGGLL